MRVCVGTLDKEIPGSGFRKRSHLVQKLNVLKDIGAMYHGSTSEMAQLVQQNSLILSMVSIASGVVLSLPICCERKILAANCKPGVATSPFRLEMAVE